MGACRPLWTAAAELVSVKRYEFANAHCWLTGHPFDAVRQPIVAARAVQLSHRHQMFGNLLW
jgi:hypothetical protein